MTETTIEKRIELLTNVLGIKISQPKYGTVMVKGQDTPLPNGSYEVTPFGDQQLDYLLALLFLDLEKLDGGRIDARNVEIKAKQDAMKAEILAATKSPDAVDNVNPGA